MRRFSSDCLSLFISRFLLLAARFSSFLRLSHQGWRGVELLNFLYTVTISLTLFWKISSHATSAEILKFGLKFGESSFDLLTVSPDSWTTWARWSEKATLKYEEEETVDWPQR